MCGLFGIQTCPPDHAVVPPTRSAFSKRATLAPPSHALMAAANPAAPVPRTTTSTCSIVLLCNRCCTTGKRVDVPRYVDHGERRQELIEAATELVARRGRSALTVRNLADALGTSTKVVSHYFDDMAELLHATYTA